MAYDESAAERVRAILRRRAGYSEKKMFGGICFLLNGNMCCGVAGTDLMLRLGEPGAADALSEPYTRAMDFTGKPLKTMIFVEPDGYASDARLRDWVGRAARFATALPAK